MGIGSDTSSCSSCGTPLPHRVTSSADINMHDTRSLFPMAEYTLPPTVPTTSKSLFYFFCQEGDGKEERKGSGERN